MIAVSRAFFYFCSMKRILPILLVLALAAGCRRPVLESGNWNPRVRQAIEQMITLYGKDAKGYDPSCKPYAVFDYDNTTVINDIAQTLLVYQIENLAFAFTPETIREVLTVGLDGWDTVYPGGLTPQRLVDDLVRDYTELYPLRNDPESYRGLAAYKDFRAKLWYLSYHSGDAHPGSEFSCVWIATLLDGMNYPEVTKLTRASVDHWMKEPQMYRENWVSPDGKVSVQIPKGLTLTPEIKELYRGLRDNGFDVYICSASVETIVEAMACDPSYGIGLDPACVFGIRLRPTPAGTVHAVADSSYAQPYREGKVRCILENIAPLHGGRGPALVAGDSNGDFAMLTSFKDLKVGLIVNCLGSGAIGGLTAGAAGKQADVRLKGRETPLYVVQGRDPSAFGFIPHWESAPVPLLPEGRE